MYIQKYYKVIRVIKDEGPIPLYIENVSDSDGVFSLNAQEGSIRPNLVYRIGDNGEWFEYDTTNLPNITVPSKSKIYLKGDNPNGFELNNLTTNMNFTFSNSFNIGGYITSLLALENFDTITDLPIYGFKYLFFRQNTLLNAKDLITENIINVGSNGFYSTFQECTNLITPPTFANVVTIGDSGMRKCFYKCENLITPPQFNKATTVGKWAFMNCFENCTSLTTAPNFSNVTSVGDKPFQYCFQGCTSLEVVYAPNISTWNTTNFSSWLNNVSPTGIVYKPTGLTIPTGINGIPDGWTTENY